MKSIKEIIDNYSDYEVPIDDRFGRRFCDFLTIEEAKQIGWEITDNKHKPKEWNRNNILKQFKDDVEFGLEKAYEERGISASLMVEVVQKWTKVLGDDIPYGNYDDYGISYLEQIKNIYKLDDIGGEE